MANVTTINGVKRFYGPRDVDYQIVREVADNGDKIVRLRFDVTDLPVVADGLVVGKVGDAFCGARLEVVTPVDSACDNATLTLGVRDSENSEIDDNGIDAAIAESAMDVAGDVVVCDGALVDDATGAGGVLTSDAYLYCTAANSPTAGVVELELRLKPNLV